MCRKNLNLAAFPLPEKTSLWAKFFSLFSPFPPITFLFYPRNPINNKYLLHIKPSEAHNIKTKYAVVKVKKTVEAAFCV